MEEAQLMDVDFLRVVMAASAIIVGVAFAVAIRPNALLGNPVPRMQRECSGVSRVVGIFRVLNLAAA